MAMYPFVVIFVQVWQNQFIMPAVLSVLGPYAVQLLYMSYFLPFKHCFYLEKINLDSPKP